MHPVNGFTLVAPINNETVGMLLVPESYGSDQLQTGTVVEVAGDTEFEVGDIVFYSRNNIVWVRYQDEEYYLIRNTNIISYVKKQGQD
jgi:co-chaperonin GroES (HSP10)